MRGYFSRAAKNDVVSLAPTKAAEAALLRTLSPGAYTAILRGVNGSSGIAVVEAYNLP